MAAFAAAVKIDSFAYMPVQDFGNAFSTFVAQNYGARQYGRIREGIQKAVRLTLVFCLAVSVLVLFWARPLMLIFVQPQETATIAAGVIYKRYAKKLRTSQKMQDFRSLSAAEIKKIPAVRTMRQPLTKLC